MTYRYGYEVIDEKPTLHHHIILEAKEGQVIVAPMDGKVSLDGENVGLTSGKGVNKTKLTLFGIHSGRVSEHQQVLAGDEFEIMTISKVKVRPIKLSQPF